MRLVSAMAGSVREALARLKMPEELLYVTPLGVIRAGKLLFRAVYLSHVLVKRTIGRIVLLNPRLPNAAHTRPNIVNGVSSPLFASLFSSAGDGANKLS